MNNAWRVSQKNWSAVRARASTTVYNPECRTGEFVAVAELL